MRHRYFILTPHGVIKIKSLSYTSADSVFQIACHEETFGLQRLYDLCKIAREILTDSGYNIGRVIARPFVGAKAGQFDYTGNRHDLAVPPPSATILQKLVEEKGGTVVSVGKIANIYAQVGISKKVKATGLNALFDAPVREMDAAGDNTLVFTNFVDFDWPTATGGMWPVMRRRWSCFTAVCRS